MEPPAPRVGGLLKKSRPAPPRPQSFCASSAFSAFSAVKEGFFSILCRGVAELRYKAWGETRYTWGTTPTTYRYTGQRQEEGLGLYHMGARFYDPALSRWLSADTVVPEAGKPQSLNRYSYVYNNPLKYRDPSGHIAWLVIGAIALKALDYGWTAWDGYQSSRVLADPNASRGDKLMAGLNVAVSLVFEAIEPDDLIPVGLPADDVARKALMKAAREAYEEGGEEALERVIRDQLGDHADEVLNKLDETLSSCPGCGQPNPQVLRSRGAIVTKQHIDPTNLGKDGISAWCSNCTADSGKFWGRSAAEIQEFARQIGLDPNKALVYTPQYGGTGHWSLFLDAIGPDGYLLPQYADLIDEFLRAGIPVKR